MDRLGWNTGSATRKLWEVVKIPLEIAEFKEYLHIWLLTISMVWQLFAAKERCQQLDFNYRHARSLPSIMSIEHCEAQSSLTIPA